MSTDGPGAVVVATGTFTTGATVGASSTIGLSFGSTSGSVKINGGSSVIIPTTNGGATPIIGFNGLTLTAASTAVPEPASIVISGMGFVGVAGLTVLRRRARKA